MRSRNASLWGLVGLGTSAAVMFAQYADGQNRTQAYIVSQDDLTWGDPPAGVAKGTPSVEPGGALQYASMRGDPLKAGEPFVIRLRCSNGYKVAPHWHPEDENIVVLQGAFSVGMGDTFEAPLLKDIPTGGYGLVPGRMNHFALCKRDTDILVYGTGPRLNNRISAPR